MAKEKKLEIGDFLKKIDAYATNVHETMTTGFTELDEIIGNGFPVGRSVEIFGDESGGKSSVTLAMVGEFIRQGKRCLWVDMEDSFMPEYAERLGVDSDKLHVMPGLETGEQTLEALEEIIKNGMVDVIVIDSMTEVVPQVWIEDSSNAIGRRAELHGRFLMHTRNDRIKNDITLILLNQTRAPIGDTGMYLIRKSTAANSTLHEVKVRIRMSRSTVLKSGDDVVGYKYKAEIVKNKVGPVKGYTYLHYMIATGFDKAWDTLDYAVKKGVIQKDGANYSINGEKIAYGEQRAVQAVRELMKDESFVKKLKEAMV